VQGGLADGRREALPRVVKRFLAATVILATGAAMAAPPKSLPELLAQSPASDWRALDPANTLYMEIPQGRVVIVVSSDQEVARDASAAGARSVAAEALVGLLARTP